MAEINSERTFQIACNKKIESVQFTSQVDFEKLIGNDFFPHITSIWLNGFNKNTQLPSLKNFPNLTSLTIDSHNLKEFSELKTPLLKELNLIYCKGLRWKQVLSILAKLPNLHTLNIGGIRNSKLPEFNLLTSLRTLTFSSDLAKRFSWDEYFSLIEKMPNLEVFEATNIETKISHTITKAKHLKKLQISAYHAFTSYPIEVLELENTTLSEYWGYKGDIDTKINELNANKELSLTQKKLIFSKVINTNYLRDIIPNILAEKDNSNSWFVFLPHRLTGFTVKELNNTFKEKKIQFTTKLSSKITHIVVSKKLSDAQFKDFVEQEYDFILEDDIKNVQWEKETPYLMDEQGEENTEELNEQILTLLIAPHEENSLLALSIMETGGVNTYLMNHVVALKLAHPSPKVRKLAAKVIQTYASNALKNHLGDRTVLTRSVKRRDVDFVTTHEEIDTAEFLTSFYNIVHHNPIHRLQKGHFSLSKIDLKELPKSLKHWQNMVTHLDVSFNKNLDCKQLIEDLEKYQSSITSLDLASLHTNIPEEITNLSQLEKLQLRHNIFRDISCLHTLKNLKELNLQNCKVETMDQLPTNLISLTMSRNKLNTFPESILSCRKLRILDLQNNELKWVPTSLRNIQSLSLIKLSEHTRFNLD